MSTVSISDDLYAKAAGIAAQTGRSLSTVIEDALRKGLVPPDSHPSGKRIELVKDGTGGVLPGVDLDCSAHLLDLMDSSNAAD